MTGPCLVLNAGSSSIKFAVFPDPATAPRASLRGAVRDIPKAPVLTVSGRGREALDPVLLRGGGGGDHEACLGPLFEWLRGRPECERLRTVAHRIVHGGAAFAAPTCIDDDVLATLEGLVPLAPLHQPHGLSGICCARGAFPGAVQVACFDTAFHRTQPQVAQLCGLPGPWGAQGVRRYGFHGLSCEHAVERLRALAPAAAAGRVIVAHLGQGCSLTAIRGGRSVATTMGFSALDGVPMGTRSGSLDPGVLLHLLRAGLDVDGLEDLLYRRSGLLGVSGESGDMRELLRSASPGARLAVDWFVYRVGRELGSLAAALQGLDALVFTGGIGENSPEIRARVCAAARWLGAELDTGANEAEAAQLASPGSRVRLFRIEADEEGVMARQATGLRDAV